MKKITKKLSFKAETIRNLTGEQLQHVAGGSVSVYDPSIRMTTVSSGTSVISISGGTSVISHNPSGGSH